MVEDLFALLGEPRRPWLDPDQVKETFHLLSRTEHPDHQATPLPGNQSSSAAFARLNHAHATLSDPKTRLRHLLELEYQQIKLTGPSSVPEALANHFAPVHGLLQEIDALLAKKAAATSALAKALLARDEHRLREKTETRLKELEALHTTAVSDLQAFDLHWTPRPPDADSRLREFYQRFAYLTRWIDQLRERLFQLGM